ncbi:hypothetical protein LUU34_01173800 [Aix galericulata]|nr:hypothetical protein LUU34_01173800 [Aix galericulata]
MPPSSWQRFWRSHLGARRSRHRAVRAAWAPSLRQQAGGEGQGPWFQLGLALPPGARALPCGPGTASPRGLAHACVCGRVCAARGGCARRSRGREGAKTLDLAAGQACVTVPPPIFTTTTLLRELSREILVCDCQ